MEGWWQGREEPAGSAGRNGKTRCGSPGPGPGLDRKWHGVWRRHSSHSRRGGATPAEGVGWDCVSRAACHSPSVPPQALVDDTEDVSLDFGNEEELAFRKAKIR